MKTIIHTAFFALTSLAVAGCGMSDDDGANGDCSGGKCDTTAGDIDEIVPFFDEADGEGLGRYNGRLDYLKRARFLLDAPDLDTLSYEDVLNGPRHKKAYPFEAAVTCKFRKPGSEMNGKTSKFQCKNKQGKMKVKYQQDGWGSNEGVQAETAATRVLWLAGFPADGMYPVMVNCVDCPADPYYPVSEDNPAIGWSGPGVVERKFAGAEIEYTDKVGKEAGQGFAFFEMEAHAGSTAVDTPAARAEMEAITVMAAFLQHTDNKDEQQRLTCPQDQINVIPENLDPEDDEVLIDTAVLQHCDTPIGYMQDMGVTFSRGHLLPRWGEPTRFPLPLGIKKLDLDDWLSVPLFNMDHHDRTGECKTNYKQIFGHADSHTPNNPIVSETGRAIVEERLRPLAYDREKLVAIFTAAHVDKTTGNTPEEWADAFTTKFEQLIDITCTNEPVVVSVDAPDVFDSTDGVLNTVTVELYDPDGADDIETIKISIMTGRTPYHGFENNHRTVAYDIPDLEFERDTAVKRIHIKLDTGLDWYERQRDYSLRIEAFDKNGTKSNRFQKAIVID